MEPFLYKLRFSFAADAFNPCSIMEYIPGAGAVNTHGAPVVTAEWVSTILVSKLNGAEAVPAALDDA